VHGPVIAIGVSQAGMDTTPAWGREICGDLDVAERWLEGTSPVWTYAVGDALVEKRIWMEPGANTTYVRYTARRARTPLGFTLRVLVNYRDYHATTRAGDWRMTVAPIPHGVRVTAFDVAHAFDVLAAGAEARPAHDWYRDFDLAREAERGLDHVDDALHAVTFSRR
jgi:hypothetical protein